MHTKSLRSDVPILTYGSSRAQGSLICVSVCSEASTFASQWSDVADSKQVMKKSI